MERKYFFENTKYKFEFDKAKRANDNVSNVSCTKLSSNVSDIKELINGINLVSCCNDTVGNAFNNSKKTCLSSLDQVINSINTSFKQSEELYKNLYEQLDYLKNTDLLYQKTFNSKPKMTDEKYKIRVFNQETKEYESKIDYTKYQSDLSKWESAIKELENNCKSMQEVIDEYLVLLEAINGMSIGSSNSLNIPSLVIPNTKNFFDFIDYAKIINMNLAGEGYLLDIVVDFDGKLYFAFAQGGYLGGDQLQYERFAYTDGKGATSISGAACSMCSLLNGLSNMLGIERVVEAFGLNPNDLNYKDGSLNSSLLIGINDKATELGTTKDKRVGIEKICDAYFSDDVDVTPTTYKNLDKDTLKKVHDGDAFIIVRLKKNSSDKYKTGGGHYIAMVDYDEQTNKGLFIDSAVQIDSNDSTINSLKPNTSSRTRVSWGSLESNENGETPLTKVLRSEPSSYDISKNIGDYNLIVVSKK